MRCQWRYLPFAIAWVAISVPVVVAERYVVRPRQDQTLSPTPTRAVSVHATRNSNAVSSTLENVDSIGSTTADASTLTHKSQKGPSSSVPAIATSESHSVFSSITASEVSPSTSSVSVTSNNGTIPFSQRKACMLRSTGTRSSHPDGLPLHPPITPALSVAGAVLILSGVFYTLIGIKTKW